MLELRHNAAGNPLSDRPPLDETHSVGAGNLASTNVRCHNDNSIGEVHVATFDRQSSFDPRPESEAKC